MANTLVDPLDLTDYPGAPFAAAVVDAAATAIRQEAGWDISPPATETVTLDGTVGQVLVLPTLKLSSVSEVRDVTDGGSTVITGWSLRRNSMLYRPEGWPHRLQSIEVDMVHGYTSTPDDLFPLIAEMCNVFATDGMVTQKSVGSFSTSFRALTNPTSGRPRLLNAAVLNRYRINADT